MEKSSTICVPLLPQLALMDEEVPKLYIPTLLQLALRSLITKLMFEKTQKHLDEFTFNKQKIILEWEFKQMLDELPKMCKTNDICFEVETIKELKKND